MKRNKKSDTVNKQEDEDGYAVRRGPNPDNEKAINMPDINIRDYVRSSDIRAQEPVAGKPSNAVSGGQMKAEMQAETPLHNQ